MGWGLTAVWDQSPESVDAVSIKGKMYEENRAEQTTP